MSDQCATLVGAPAGDTPSEAVYDADKVYKVGLKEDLLDALKEIKFSGSFAVSGELRNLPPVIIDVPGVGKIKMPLEEGQARELIATARQAPYGKGAETVVDTAVRNTWELDAGQVSIQHPNWNSYLQLLVAKVKRMLGVTGGSIKAELYKMLIYEKGAMFKAHTDSEKIPGMFGTLVIALPSEHEGGEIVLKHCGQTKIFKSSQHEASWACWYSDVSHQILPVKSGYRWVLTFNLALTPYPGDPAPPSGVHLTAHSKREELSVIRQTLQTWLSTRPSMRTHHELFHTLDHDYTEANVSWATLKGRDLAQVLALRSLSKELPFDIFLALLEKESVEDEDEDDWAHNRYMMEEEEEDYDEDDVEYEYERRNTNNTGNTVFEQTHRVRTLRDLDDKIVVTDLDFTPKNMLDSQFFDEIDPDDEEHTGFTGNEGQTATYRYHATAVVIVPRDDLLSFLYPSRDGYSSKHDGTTVQTLIQYLASASLRAPSSPVYVQNMVQLCDTAWTDWVDGQGKHYARKAALDGETMQKVLQTVVQLGQTEMFEKYAARHQGALSPNFFRWVRDWLRLGDPDQDSAMKRFEDVRNGLSRAVTTYHHLEKQLQAICMIAPRFRRETSGEISTLQIAPPVLDWVRETLQSCVEARLQSSLSREEGTALAEMFPYFDHPAQYLSNVVEKIAQKNHAPAFVIAFVSALHGHLEENRIPVKDGLLLLKTVSMTVINGVNLSLLRCKETAEAPAPVAKYPRYEHYGFATQQATLPAVLIQRQVITPEDMIGFASALLRPELREDGNDLLAALASKLQEQCQELPVDELNSIWVPFLRSFSHLVLESGVVHDISPYRELYVTLLNSWLVRYVRHESKEGESLVRETLKCHCGDCLQLNIFLASAERQQGQFSMNKDRRQHLHQMLDKERIDCTHETSRVGNPQTLVVTKTFKFKSNKIVRQEWKRRYEMAVKHLGAFQQDHLAALLGPEQYSHITKMTHLRASQSRSQRRRSGQLELHPESANPSVLAPSIALHHRQGHPTVPPPVTGVKRRHAPSEEDVIDLT